MASDTDWVEDVKRWYFSSGKPPLTRVRGTGQPEAVQIADRGFEAARLEPVTKNWAEHANSGFNNLA